MHAAENLYSEFRYAVKQQAACDWKTPVSRPQIVTSAAKMWIMSKQDEALRREINEPVRRHFIFIGNLLADIKNMLTGAPH